MAYIFLIDKNKWVKEGPEKEKQMDKTVTFKVEYTVQMTEAKFNSLKDKDGNYIRTKLLDDGFLKKQKFFAKTICGKVKDFDTFEN